MGGFKLLKPSDKNIEKIEEVMGDDKKMRLIKDKNIKDFDMDDIKDVDIILGGSNARSNIIHPTLVEIFQNNNDLEFNSNVNGLIGFEITLQHNNKCQFELTENAIIANNFTSGDITKIVIVTESNGKLFSANNVHN